MVYLLTNQLDEIDETQLSVLGSLVIDLIERTFQREGSPYLACNDRNAFFTSEKKLKNIMHGHVKIYVVR